MVVLVFFNGGLVALFHLHNVSSVFFGYYMIYFTALTILVLCFLSQIPINQNTVMDDIEKWLELDDEVNSWITEFTTNK